MLILTRADVQQLITIEPLIAAVEAAHAALSSGRAIQTVEEATVLPGGGAVMLPMAAALGAERGTGVDADAPAIAGVKLLTDAPGNRDRGWPSQHSTITVIDPETGLCLALIDGVEITRYRTAAASAVATRYLARDDTHTLGLIGAGNLARTHLQAMRAVREFERVIVWSRSKATADSFIAACDDGDLIITRADTAEEVVAKADVLCTLTPSHEPLIHGAWFTPGLHVNAVGAPPRPDHREIDSEGIRRSRVIVDDLSAATSRSGEICVPLARGELAPDHIRGELGDVILARIPGRENQHQITLFNSVGLAIQDFAAARHILALAHEREIGTRVDLNSTEDLGSYTKS